MASAKDYLRTGTKGVNMGLDMRSEPLEQYREWEESRLEYERLAVACVRERSIVPVLILTARDDAFLKACGVRMW